MSFLYDEGFDDKKALTRYLKIHFIGIIMKNKLCYLMQTLSKF